MKDFISDSALPQDTTDPVTELLNAMFDATYDSLPQHDPHAQVTSLVNEINLSIDDTVESLIIDMGTEQAKDAISCLIKDMKLSGQGNKN